MTKMPSTTASNGHDDHALPANRLTESDPDAIEHFRQRVSKMVASDDQSQLWPFLRRWWPSFNVGLSRKRPTPSRKEMR